MVTLPGAFTARVVRALRAVPRGRVVTYGQLALMAGNPQAARQVVRVLCTMSGKEHLPWHRVINAKGMIALAGAGFREQKALLEQEGIEVVTGRIDLNRFQWRP